jgi:hypothetical protein
MEIRTIDIVILSSHLVIALLVGVVIMTPRLPPGPVMMVDDRPFFSCVKTGCWHRVLGDHSWASLASALDADEAGLRRENPQISSTTTISSGALIVIPEGVRSRNVPPK